MTRRAPGRWTARLTLALAIVLAAGACADDPPATPVSSPTGALAADPSATLGSVLPTDAIPATTAPATTAPATTVPPTSPPPSTAPPTPAVSAGPGIGTFPTVSFHVVNLPMAKRAYASSKPVALHAPRPVDAAGVPLSRYGTTLTYHPVGLATRALQLLDTYRLRKDHRYLNAARAVADRLVKMSVVVRGARYLPYLFDFPLHGDRSEVLRAPWYSGMAQGMALSVFARLHALEGRPEDLEVARSLFASLRPHGRKTPWVTAADSAGYLWIQEYPGRHPDDTLNGFNFALFGVYDYLMETGDPDAQALLAAGLTTVLHYLPRFRNPGDLSYYCLRHHVTSAKYHRIHVAQLRLLAKMTESPVFARWARLFDADA